MWYIIIMQTILSFNNLPNLIINLKCIEIIHYVAVNCPCNSNKSLQNDSRTSYFSYVKQDGVPLLHRHQRGRPNAQMHCCPIIKNINNGWDLKQNQIENINSHELIKIFWNRPMNRQKPLSSKKENKNRHCHHQLSSAIFSWETQQNFYSWKHHFFYRKDAVVMRRLMLVCFKKEKHNCYCCR